VTPAFLAVPHRVSVCVSGGGERDGRIEG
jgi:hypothetical protein